MVLGSGVQRSHHPTRVFRRSRCPIQNAFYRAPYLAQKTKNTGLPTTQIKGKGLFRPATRSQKTKGAGHVDIPRETKGDDAGSYTKPSSTCENKPRRRGAGDSVIILTIEGAGWLGVSASG